MKALHVRRGGAGLETALRTLQRSSRAEGEPNAALRDTVDAIGAIAERAAAASAFDALLRRELVRRGTRILSTIIRRGLASGAFRPDCAPWATRILPHAIAAGVCARWAFGLTEGRSLRASAAANAALGVLCPTGPAVPTQHDAQPRVAGEERHARSSRHFGVSIKGIDGALEGAAD